MAIFADWYLPSKDEFAQIKQELILQSVGDFTEPTYWTSSETNAFVAWSDGTGDHGDTFKVASFAVRAIRSFNSATNYALRDVGPAGGWIFYKNGNDYLEAAPYDCDYSVWSNIQDTAVGTTGTAIGTGNANTGAIISQGGHVTSAAKLCADLIVDTATTGPATTTTTTSTTSTTTTTTTTTTEAPVTTTASLTTTPAPMRGVTISHNQPTRVTSTGIIPSVTFVANPGIGDCYEFIDMFIKASYKPYNVVVSTDPDFTDYALITSNYINEYNTGWYHIKRLPRTIGSKVLIGKVLYVRVDFEDCTKFYDLKVVKTGYTVKVNG